MPKCLLCLGGEPEEGAQVGHDGYGHLCEGCLDGLLEGEEMDLSITRVEPHLRTRPAFHTGVLGWRDTQYGSP